MEQLSEQGFLEEILATRRENWDTFPGETNGVFSTLDCFDENLAPMMMIPNPFSQEFSMPFELDSSFSFNGAFGDEFLMPQMPYPVQEEYEEPSLLLADELDKLEMENILKMGQNQSPEAPVFNIGTSQDSKNRAKKVEGQPSKNLMAERRRRKRLNDRLSMLRSIVPKISKMDRTAIVGDTIDYIKELMDKIRDLQQEMETSSSQWNNFDIPRNVKQNEVVVRNTPKFEVERRNVDTRIEICCAGKPGMLLSTISTLEALSLEIQQCAISCFNDFTMQASCSEDVEQRAIVSSEDIKQALFRTAGYAGRCL